MDTRPPSQYSLPELQQLADVLEALDDYDTETAEVSDEEKSLVRSAVLCWHDLDSKAKSRWRLAGANRS